LTETSGHAILKEIPRRFPQHFCSVEAACNPLRKTGIWIHIECNLALADESKACKTSDIPLAILFQISHQEIDVMIVSSNKNNVKTPWLPGILDFS
jgi:hypothetical protein